MRLPRDHRRYGLVLSLVLASTVIGGATALASHRFVDVPTDHVFHDDIDWLADNGITLGCNPPTNDEYCPGDFTTRGEMAAFLKRLAESGVVDAGTLDGFDSTDFLGVGDQAADADTLDGLDSTDFLGVGDQAADADTLDGLDSTAFLGSTVTARDADLTLVATENNSVTVNCLAGEQVIAGGFDSSALVLDVLDIVNYTENHSEGNGWTVGVTSTVSGTITVFAMCAATS